MLEVALEIFLAAQPDYNATPTLHSSQGSGHIRPGTSNVLEMRAIFSTEMRVEEGLIIYI